MFQEYVKFVNLVRPKFLILENVPGMGVAHKDGRGIQRATFYQKLIAELDASGYDAKGRLLDAADFGVPQRRSRLVVIGVAREFFRSLGGSKGVDDPLDLIEAIFEGAEAEGLCSVVGLALEKLRQSRRFQTLRSERPGNRR